MATAICKKRKVRPACLAACLPACVLLLLLWEL